MGEHRQFSVSVYAAKTIRMTIRDVRQMVNAAADAGGDRREGAGVTVLDRWMRAHEQSDFLFGALWDQNIETMEQLLGLCNDLAESTAVLLDHASPPAASPFVLVRSLGETVMRIAHMLDAEARPARTVARIAAYQLESIEGNLRAAEAFGTNGKTDAKEARENIRQMHRSLSDAGFQLFPDRREPFTVSIGIDGERENLKFDATAAFKRYLPSSPWLWELGSGVTHARGWMIGGLIETTRTDPITSAMDVALSAAGAVVELADTFARIAVSQTGLDVDSFLKANHLRRRGITSWTPNAPTLSVDHTEYARRDGNWKPKPFVGGESFHAKPSGS